MSAFKERIVSEYWLMIEHQVQIKTAQILIHQIHGVPARTLRRWTVRFRKGQNDRTKR